MGEVATPPDRDYFAALKLRSEEMWRGNVIRQELWGFQIQPGTHWNSGLSEGEILQYEKDIGARFQPVFRDFLGEMNGTDMLALDVRGSSGEPRRLAPGFYAYPRDLAIVQELIGVASLDRAKLRATLLEEGFCLSEDAQLVPIFAHRYAVCSPIDDAAPVLSVWDASDAIVYGNSLREYLEREIFSQ